ncbi:MAG: transcription antitermination factor NusB [Bacillota bacterium]|nr:transcription antitermination factor NusB [Bacillota bacterium]
MTRQRRRRAQTAREAVVLTLDVCLRSEVVDASTLLDRQLPEGDPRQDRFAHALLYRALLGRYRNTALLERLSRRPLERLDPPLAAILLAAVTELETMDGSPPYAVVNESVNIARRQLHGGAAGFANGILRRWLRARPDDRDLADWQRLGLHPATFRLLTERLGRETVITWLEASCAALPLTVRLTQPLTQRLGLGDGPLTAPFEHQSLAPARLLPAVYMPTAAILELCGAALTELEVFKEGGLYVQGEAAQLPVYLAGLKEGERVLDLCAAPGGKTIQAAAAVAPSGQVLAVDIEPRRLERLGENLKRLGVQNIRLLEHDGRCGLPPDAVPDGGFDLVLVDAPCSGLGRIADLPEMRSRDLAATESGLIELQRALLKAGSRYLRPGGRLVYSTCTINPAENEDVVRDFLHESGKNWRPVDLRPLLPPALAARDFISFSRPDAGGISLWPPPAGTEGFFVALLERL